VPKDERDTIFHEYFPQTDNVDPNAPQANPTAPAEKKKTWNLNWGPLSWMADMSAQRPVTRFSLDLWMNLFCRSMGAPILMLQAHAVARTMCSCKNFSLDPQGDHVLACKKHTGATRGHNHVIDFLAQLARNAGYSVRVNHKVSTTAVASTKQGHVEIVHFGLDGYNSLVIDVSIWCDHVGNSTINNGHLNGKMHTNGYLQARATIKNNQYKADYAAVSMAFAPQLCQWLAKFIPSFFVSYRSWLTNRRAITLRSSVQRRRLAARLSRRVEHARLVLTRTLLARPLLMPLPHAYTFPCTVQLCRRVVNLASPLHQLNASCTALHMHHTALPLTLHPLAPLSTWMLVHPESRHLLMQIMQVPLERETWLMMVHTLPAVTRPRNGLQPILVVVVSPQVVQVPVLARTMTHRVTTMTITR